MGMFEHADSLALLDEAAPAGAKIRAIHEALRRQLPFVDRAAAALYDCDGDLVKTFVASPAEDSPLRAYEARLSDSPLLLEVSRARRPRVINDMSVLAGSTREHSQRLLAHGYRASYVKAFHLALF